MTEGPADALHAWLLENRDGQVAFLAELVRMPSDNPPGDCAAHAERTATMLEALGLAVERHPVPAHKARQAGMIAVTNLVVRHRFGPGPVVALNAHGDVVPPGDGWTRDPYGATIADGWMYGRGVAVSKSDFATYGFALLALRHLAQSGRCRLHGTVELHFTYDEEAGGEIGPRLLLEQGLTKPDLAIGAGFSYGVVTAHNGCLHLEVQLFGRSAHAARPGAGVDAMQAASAVLSRLYAWRETLAGRISAIPGIGAPQLTIGMIAGGINTNVVPDLVTFRLDRRITPDENVADAEAELRAVIEAAAARVSGIHVSIKRILLALPLTPDGSGKPLTTLLCDRASQIMGEKIGETAVPLYTDARHYAAHGVPTVLYGAGPRTIEDANAHRADERLPLSDLFAATEVLALALCDFLRLEPAC
jgi:acetylornithine deacetylase/succinyl-diaminopimelate desuccinylase-like protein